MSLIGRIFRKKKEEEKPRTSEDLQDPSICKNLIPEEVIKEIYSTLNQKKILREALKNPLKSQDEDNPSRRDPNPNVIINGGTIVYPINYGPSTIVADTMKRIRRFQLPIFLEESEEEEDNPSRR